jgi:colanic acid/amylovoran biosynthesis glycosyltransferase
MEGIPVALMEALASGRPVVSTNISGIPELVEHDVSGLLVAEKDPVALARAMRELLENPTRARGMGLNGREKVRREFDIVQCVHELIGLLDGENALEAAA